VLLCIRPEIINLNQGGGVKGEVEEKLFSGDRVRMRVRVGETLLNVSLAPDEAEGVEVGAKVSVSVNEEEVVLLEDEKDAI